VSVYGAVVESGQSILTQSLRGAEKSAEGEEGSLAEINRETLVAFLRASAIGVILSGDCISRR